MLYLSSAKKIWLLPIICLFTFSKQCHGMNEKQATPKKYNYHLNMNCSTLFWIAVGAGLPYAYQYAHQWWYPNSKNQNAEEKNIERKEKLLELDIKKAHLIQTHEEAVAKFSLCEERGLSEKFCENMRMLHEQTLERIRKENITDKNNIKQPCS